jgi:hypothetical protein
VVGECARFYAIARIFNSAKNTNGPACDVIVRIDRAVVPVAMKRLARPSDRSDVDNLGPVCRAEVLVDIGSKLK